jgi:hypothetical protein
MRGVAMGRLRVILRRGGRGVVEFSVDAERKKSPWCIKV